MATLFDVCHRGLLGTEERAHEVVEELQQVFGVTPE
jgi:hypothetical protein